MRQRNDTAFELYAPGDPPLVIASGEVVEHDVHLVGLTQLADDESTTKPKKAAKAEAAPSGEEPTE